MFALIVILVAIALAAVIALFLWSYGDEGYESRHVAAQLIGFVIMLGAGLSSLAYAFCAWSWIAAESKAQIINREYGTDYTREEVFFASDVIDTIREIDRKRVEVNGDLLRENKD